VTLLILKSNIMKKKNLSVLKLSKKTISNISNTFGGRKPFDISSDCPETMTCPDYSCGCPSVIDEC
jgi:hypothetical protein